MRPFRWFLTNSVTYKLPAGDRAFFSKVCLLKFRSLGEDIDHMYGGKLRNLHLIPLYSNCM